MPEVKAARDVVGAADCRSCSTELPVDGGPGARRWRAGWLRSTSTGWRSRCGRRGTPRRARRGPHSPAGFPPPAGENHGTVWDFRPRLRGEGHHLRPAERDQDRRGDPALRRVMTLAETSGVQVVPHFGVLRPGLLASIHCIAAMPTESLVERFYCDFAENPLGEAIHPQQGRIADPRARASGCRPRLATRREAPGGVTLRMLRLAAAGRAILAGCRATRSCWRKCRPERREGSSCEAAPEGSRRGVLAVREPAAEASTKQIRP